MSQENVDRLKAALDSYNREGPEAIIDLLDSDVEWIADRSDMGRVTYRVWRASGSRLKSCMRASTSWAWKWTS